MDTQRKKFVELRDKLNKLKYLEVNIKLEESVRIYKKIIYIIDKEIILLLMTINEVINNLIIV